MAFDRTETYASMAWVRASTPEKAITREPHDRTERGQEGSLPFRLQQIGLTSEDKPVRRRGDGGNTDPSW